MNREKSKKKMSMELQVESDGTRYSLKPHTVVPLDARDLWRLRDDVASSFVMNVIATNALKDGLFQQGEFNAKVTLGIKENIGPVALIRGGWLPMPFAVGSAFLLDRNVMSALRNFHRPPSVANGAGDRWWLRFFEDTSVVMSPLPFAWEGGYRRAQSFEEFSNSFEAGVSELRSAFPSAIVKQVSTDQLTRLFQIIASTKDNEEREIDFLMSAIPLILDRVSSNRSADVFIEGLQLVDSVGIERSSLVVLAVISCLHEDPHGKTYGVGRNLLKPKKMYSVFDAFNAVSDLRHLEQCCILQSAFPNERYALATCDVAVASFWSALRLRFVCLTSTGKAILEFELAYELVPRCSNDQRRELLRAIGAKEPNGHS